MRLSLSPILYIGVVVIGIVAGTGYFLFKDTVLPEVALAPEVKVVALGQKLSVTATDKDSGIRAVTVLVVFCPCALAK